MLCRDIHLNQYITCNPQPYILDAGIVSHKRERRESDQNLGMRRYSMIKGCQLKVLLEIYRKSPETRLYHHRLLHFNYLKFYILDKYIFHVSAMSMTLMTLPLAKAIKLV